MTVSKGFTSLLISYSLLSFINRILQFIIIFYLWLTLKEPFIIGTIILFETIFSFFSGVLLSKISRFISNTKILNLAFTFKFLCTIILAIFIHNDFIWFLWIIPLSISSLFDNFMAPIVYGKIGEYIQSNTIKHNSLVSMIDNISLFVSPVIGSFLLLWTNNNIVPLLMFSSIIFIVCILSIKGNVAFLNSESVVSTKDKDKVNFKWLINHKIIFSIIVHFMVLNIMLIPLLNILYPAFITIDHKESSFYLAYFEIMFSIGLFSMSAFSFFIKSSLNYLKISIYLPFLMAAIGLIIISLTPSLIISGSGSLLIGMSLSMLRIGNNSYFQEILSPNIQIEFFAIRASLLSSVAPLSTVIVSFILNILSSSMTMFIFSLILLILSFSMYLTLTRVSNKNEEII